MHKKIFGFLLAIVVCIGSLGVTVPQLTASAADEQLTVKAKRTVGFNSADEWLMGNHNSGEWGGTDLLIAAGGTGWTIPAETTFTDSDGSMVTTAAVSGTTFNTPRNAVVTFDIPRNKSGEYIRSVELDLTIRNLKQVSAGARLAIYGNSLTSVWDASSGKTVFGASGDSSGLDQLELLGFMDAITLGNTGSTAVDSGQTIALSSKKLTEYVRSIVDDSAYVGGELSFRLAGPHVGGIRVYSEYAAAAYQPTLKITYSEEPVKYSSVTVKTVDSQGSELRPDTTYENIEVGNTYNYGTPAEIIQDDDDIFYQFNESASVLSFEVTEDAAANVVRLVYDRLGEADVDVSGNTVTEEGAWCWFADPRALHYENEDGSINKTYIGYIDVHGAIKATQYNHNTKETNEVLVRSNFQPDDHNNPTFLALPDGRIMIFYSRHTDESCFYYRISKEPGDLTTLGQEKKLVTSHNTTYPTPFVLSSDPDHIYLTWRGINWHPTLARLTMPDENDDVTFDWGPKQIVSSSVGSNIRPYAKYVSDGVSKIHMTYTATHPDNTDPNPIYYSYIDITDMTLRDMGGNKLTEIANSPFAINGNETDAAYVVDDRSTSNRGWVWEIALDDDKPVIAMVRISSDKNSHDYYYAKWSGTGWTKTFLANAGGRFHSSNTEYCYSGGLTLDKENPNIIYASVPVEGIFGKVYEIVKYEMSGDGKNIVSETQITKNSRKNNVRPFIVKNAHENELRLLWMNGDYYYWIVNSTYAGYPTSIRTDFDLPKPGMDVTGSLLVDYDFQTVEGNKVRNSGSNYDADLLGSAAVSNGVLELTGTGDGIRIDEDVFADEAMGSFTISMNANILESNYTSGNDFNLFDYAGGAFSLSVKNIASADSVVTSGTLTHGRLPVLTTTGESESIDIKSSNMLSDSDWNRSHSGNTDGSKNINNMGWTHFAVTYDAETGRTTTYVDGLVDISGTSMKNMLDSISGSSLTIGGFSGQISDVRIFSEALSQYEVTKVMDNILVDAGDENFSYKGMGLMGSEVTASFQNPDKESAVVVVTVYDSEGRVVEVKSADVDSETVKITLVSELSDKTVKGFLWDSELKPLAKATQLK